MLVRLEDHIHELYKEPIKDYRARTAEEVYEMTFVADRILNACVINDDTGCWEWTKDTRGHGYGSVKVCNKKIMAHRMSYKLFVGPLPDGLYVLHRCDNRLCINPDHLFVGTDSDNKRDCADKNRHPQLWLEGEDNPGSKLTGEDVFKIKELIREGQYPLIRIAEWFGVTSPTISDIKTGKLWKHVE